MKKNTVKSITSPAPAMKTATVLASPSAKTGTAKPGAALAPLNAKPIVPKRVATTVTALIDVGYGNSVYIRGEGAGLSWDQGLALGSVADDTWTTELSASSEPIVFKFLLNDVSWSIGEDYTVAPGTSIKVTPLF